MQASEKDNGPGIVSSPNIDAGGDKLKNLEDNDSKQNILSSKDAEAKFKDPRETPKEKSIPPSRPHGVKSPTDPWMSPPEYAGRRASRQALSRNGSEYNGTLIFRDGRAEEDNLHKLVGFLVSYTIFSDGAYFPLREGRQSIGRRKNMNICILTDRLLSEEHAVIIYRDGRFIFKDNGSTNGSFVNGKEVLEQTRLENGDTIKMGTHTYTLVVIPRIKPELPKD
jgi:predicted component of type VI protein secretion system